MYNYHILLLLTISGVTFGLLGSKKNSTVIGQLFCGRNYYASVKVEMWEADTCKLYIINTQFYIYCNNDNDGYIYTFYSTFYVSFLKN